MSFVQIDWICYQGQAHTKAYSWWRTSKRLLRSDAASSTPSETCCLTFPDAEKQNGLRLAGYDVLQCPLNYDEMIVIEHIYRNDSGRRWRLGAIKLFVVIVIRI